MSDYGLHPEDRDDTVLTILTEPSLSRIQKHIPQWFNVMKPRLSYDYFSDEDWLYERWFEGERVIVYLKEGKATLYTPGKKKVNDTYPELVFELQEVEIEDGVFDGCIVSLRSELEDKEALSRRRKINDSNKALESEDEVTLYLFDCLSFGGYDLRKVPLRERKKLLKYCMDWEDPIRFVSHERDVGKKFLSKAWGNGWKSVIMRKADSIYEGKKSSLWKTFVPERT